MPVAMLSLKPRKDEKEYIYFNTGNVTENRKINNQVRTEVQIALCCFHLAYILCAVFYSY